MEKLLSSIIKGERKGDVSEELKGKKIRVKFLGYTEEGKAKILLEDKVIIADVESDRKFTPGEELIFIVKSLYPKLELKLIQLDENWTNQFILLKLLPFFDKDSVKNILKFYMGKQFPEIMKKLKEESPLSEKELQILFQTIFSKKGKEQIFSSLKEIMIAAKGNLTEADFRKLILSLLAFYFLPVGGAVFIPLNIKDTDIELIFQKEEGYKIEINIKHKNNSVFISIFTISNEVSIEFKSENKNLIEALKSRDTYLKEKLLAAGFIPIAITYSNEKATLQAIEEKIKINLDSGTVDILV